MMKKYINSVKFTYITLSSILVVILTSCGSYQSSSYYDDGIYGEDNYSQEVETPAQRNTVAAKKSSPNIYQNYFKETSDQIQYVQEQDDVFTDVDSYSSTSVNDSMDIAQNYDYYDYNTGGNAGW